MPNFDSENPSLRPVPATVPFDSCEKLNELVANATRASCESAARAILTAKYCGCDLDPDLVEILALAIRAGRLQAIELQRGWINLHGRCPSLGSRPEVHS